MMLPYEQPVEVMRTYLDYLGSSRYQVMSTFQKDSSQVTQHAQAAEYLKIVAQEYQMLTGKNFDSSHVSPTVAVRDPYRAHDTPDEGTLSTLQTHQPAPPA